MFADVIGAAITAIVGGTATVGVVAAGVAAVGTDLSVVGMITGNQTLTKVGSVMGLAGGITGLAAGLGSDAAVSAAGNFGPTADGGNLMSAGSDAAGMGTAAGNFGPTPDGGNLMPSSGGAPDAGLSGINSGSSATSTDAATPTGTQGATPTSSEFSPTAPATNTPSGMLGSGNTAPVAGAPAAGATPEPVTGGTTTPAASLQASGTDTGAVTGNTAGSGAPSASSPDMSGTTGYGTNPGDVDRLPPMSADTSPNGIMNWYNNLDKDTQGRIVTGLMQGGGMAVGSLFNAYSAAQKLALQQQAQNLIQRQYDTSVANANSTASVGNPYSAGKAASAPVTMLKPIPVVNNGATGLANATPPQQGMLTT